MDNNRDFLDGISQTLSRTARNLSDKFNQELETTKLHGKIVTEEKAIEQLKADIGSLIYSRYDSGEVYDGELGRLCLEIADRYGKIRHLESDFARSRGKKICLSCGKTIGIESLFCPFCGTPCPPEKESEAADEEEKEKEKEKEEEDDEKIVNFASRKEEETEAKTDEAAEVKEEAKETPEEAPQNEAKSDTVPFEEAPTPVEEEPSESQADPGVDSTEE